jgi:hypothetical protein
MSKEHGQLSIELANNFMLMTIFSLLADGANDPTRSNCSGDAHNRCSLSKAFSRAFSAFHRGELSAAR